MWQSPDMTWVLIILFSLVTGVAAFLIYARSAVRRIARNILRINQRLLSGRHVYRPADPGRFPRADHSFYERMTALLAQQGFHVLGDLEDVNVTEYACDRVLHPDGGPAPSFARFLTSADATIVACIYHMISPAFVWRDGRRHRTQREFRLLEFNTELSDGTSVSTTTVGRGEMLDSPPETRRHILPADTPPEQILDRHRTHVANARSVWTAATPERIETLEKLIESLHRSQDRKVAHRRDVGVVTERELERFAGANQAIVQPVLREIRRISPRREM